MKNKQKIKLKNTRITYLDILNVIAIIAVIALHCNGIVHGNPNTRAWNTSLIVECICYFAVPLFCMLSGATLMNYREKYDTKTFFKKRFIKVLVPFAFWAIIMFIWKIHIIKTIPNINGLKNWINAFFQNKEESTYYFMYSILGIYLTLPILSLLTEKKHRKTLWFTVVLYFIFNSLIPNVLNLFEITYNTNTQVLLGGYIIFVILGYLLSTEELSRNKRIIIYIFAIIGVLYRFFTTYIMSKEYGYVIKTTWGYTSWHSILLASSVFIFIKQLFTVKISLSAKKAKLVSKISSCSFGIYLIHQIVMYYEKTIFSINTASWEWRTMGVIITYIISLIIVFSMKKIPIVKKLVP